MWLIFTQPFSPKKTKMSDLILRRTDVVTYKLPNGNIISSDGLPEGLTDESLEAVIAAVEDKDKLKVTYSFFSIHTGVCRVICPDLIFSLKFHVIC